MFCCTRRCGSVVEQLIRNQQATGSNPVIGLSRITEKYFTPSILPCRMFLCAAIAIAEGRALHIAYKKRQKARGRRFLFPALLKTLVLGLKPSLKEDVLPDAQRVRAASRREEKQRPCFKPTLKRVGSFCPLPSYFCLLNLGFYQEFQQ